MCGLWQNGKKLKHTITWSTGYGITEEIILKQIVEHAVNECDVIIICNDQNTVASYLSAHGVSSPNIYYIETNFNSIWIRDYGQNTVYKNDVEDRILVDWIYNRNRPYDDLVPEHIAAYFNADMYITTQSPYNLMGTGGNFMSDGMGTGFSSKLILDENSGVMPGMVHLEMSFTLITRCPKLKISARFYGHSNVYSHGNTSL